MPYIPARFETIRKTANLVLPLAAIGSVIANKICDTGCSYLHGAFLGMDLNHLGIVLAAAVFALGLSAWFLPNDGRATDRVLAGLLCFSVGGGAVLLHFQLTQRIFCPFCLVYGTLMAALFILNIGKARRVAGISAFAAGLVLFALFFEGSAVPVFQF